MSQAEGPVYVQLEVTTPGESHSTRHLTLNAPAYAMPIGRGSRSGAKDLYPGMNNGWFESRVMSRDHSILVLDPTTKELRIKDVGSMHGTYFRGERLVPHRLSGAIRDGEVLLFGTEVVRETEVFPALEVVLRRNSEHSTYQTAQKTLCERHSAQLSHSRNSFSVPDYDDDEEDDDSDFYVLDWHTPHGNNAYPQRNPVLPQSVESYAGSINSDDSVRERPSTTHPAGLSESQKREYTRGITAAKASFSQPSSGVAAALEKTRIVDTPSTRRSSFRYAAAGGSEEFDDVSACVFVDDSDLEEDLELDRLEREELERVRRHPLSSSTGHEASSVSSQSPMVEMIKTGAPDNTQQEQGSRLAPITIEESAPDSGPAVAAAPFKEIPPDAFRAPSPSDAALAKPLCDQIFERFSGLEDWYKGAPAYTQPPSNATHEWNPLQNFHYPGSYNQMYTTPYPPASSIQPRPTHVRLPHHGLYNDHTASYSFDQGFASTPENVAAATRRENATQAPPPASAWNDVALTKEPEHTRTACQSPKNGATVPSFKDIVVVDSQTPKLAPITVSIKNNNNKRKADQMSTVDEEAEKSTQDVDERVQDTFTDAPLPQVFTSTNPSNSEPLMYSVFPKVAFDGEELYAVTDDHLRQTPEPGTEERPKKRVKSNKAHKKHGNATSWGSAIAWTALGATLGAVGTVAGLVALPADFFV